MIVSNLAVENRFANGTQGRLMSWYPATIASNKAVLASHPELVARFVKETALTKSELFPDLVPYISSCTRSFEKKRNTRTPSTSSFARRLYRSYRVTP